MTILFPGKKVYNLFRTKLSGGVIFVAPSVLSKPVSSRNNRTKIAAKPRSATDHQYSRVHELLAATKPEIVGPTTFPKFKDIWRIVKALPR